MKGLARGSAAGVVALSLALGAVSAASAQAQDAKSVALAKQLAAALGTAKLDSIAAKDPAAPDVFIGALYFPGQLLVISAKYSAPAYLVERLGNKQYRDVIDLNGAAVANTKVFVQDAGADGLRRIATAISRLTPTKRAAKQIRLDADWKKQKLSKDDLKAFDADDRYLADAAMPLAELKKPT